MNSFILGLFLVAVALAQTTNVVPNYYEDAENNLHYCLAKDGGNTGCKCAANEIYVNGVCTSETTACTLGESQIPASYSTYATCASGMFGSSVNYCNVVDGTATIETSSHCFVDSEIPAGSVAADITLEFEEMPVFAINSQAKVQVIYGLVKLFPFMIGDVEMGVAYSKTNDITAAPVTVLQLRIITTAGYVQSFLAAEESSSEHGEKLTAFLQTAAPSIFNSAVTVTFASVESVIPAYICKEGDVDYSLNDVIFSDCDETFIGHQYKKCSVIDGAIDWSPLNTKECLTTVNNEGEDIIDITLKFENLDAAFVNCNLTLEFFPIFVEFAHTKLNDLVVYDIYPVESGSTTVNVRFIVSNTENYHLDPSKTVSQQLQEQIASEKTTPTLADKFKAIDPSRFTDSVKYSISAVYVNGQVQA